MNIQVVNGADGEGGGQILRTSLALSALMGQGLKIVNIRSRRSKPGLRAQHLTAIKAMASICKAKLQGAELDSQCLDFIPQCMPKGELFHFDVNDAGKTFSAGSVTLILQALLLPLMFADTASTVTLHGGTFVPFSPSYHYIQHTFLPALAQLGGKVRLSLEAWGWMQAGRGKLTAKISPVTQPLHSISLTNPIEQSTSKVAGVAAVTNLPAHISQRMANRAMNVLQKQNISADIEIIRERGAGAGAGICLWLADEQRYAGFGALGRKGYPADKVADQATQQMIDFLQEPVSVDPYLADQLLLPMALSAGISRISTSRLTQHTLTNAKVLEQWLNTSIEIKGTLDNRGEIIVHGIGFQPPK